MWHSQLHCRNCPDVCRWDHSLLSVFTQHHKHLRPKLVPPEQLTASRQRRTKTTPRNWLNAWSLLLFAVTMDMQIQTTITGQDFKWDNDLSKVASEVAADLLIPAVCTSHEANVFNSESQPDGENYKWRNRILSIQINNHWWWFVHMENLTLTSHCSLFI